MLCNGHLSLFIIGSTLDVSFTNVNERALKKSREQASSLSARGVLRVEPAKQQGEGSVFRSPFPTRTPRKEAAACLAYLVLGPILHMPQLSVHFILNRPQLRFDLLHSSLQLILQFVD